MIASPVTKLIDEAILPASALILAKVAGLVLVILTLKLPYQFELGTLFKVLPVIKFDNAQDYLIAESYSNLAMFTAAALGTFLVLIRAHFFHVSHISPKTHTKLISLNIEWLLAPSYHLYHQALIWLTYLWLSVGFLTAHTLAKSTYPQVAIIGFVVAVNFSWVFALDVQKEINLTREA